MESRRTTRRAEEPEWSPKGRAKLRLPFQSFCLSSALLLPPPPPRARPRVSVSTCMSLSFVSRFACLPSVGSFLVLQRVRITLCNCKFSNLSQRQFLSFSFFLARFLASLLMTENGFTKVLTKKKFVIRGQNRPHERLCLNRKSPERLLLTFCYLTHKSRSDLPHFPFSCTHMENPLSALPPSPSWNRVSRYSTLVQLEMLNSFSFLFSFRRG